jgi:hypothetical protein
MTRLEIQSKLPFTINHRTWGHAELEIIVDNNELKGLCYRHPDKKASFGTYGKDWDEVYSDLNEYLISNGYVK